MKQATLYTDGGARGNPGPAGIGYVLQVEQEEPKEYKEYIGNATNNQAEYRALLAGLTGAFESGVKRLTCYLDSELVVRQLNGEYKVKQAHLRPLFEAIKGHLRGFEHVVFEHVPRHKNKQADRLVNQAIDAALGK